MGREVRLDVGGQLRAPRKTPQGFLRVDGHATRVGVFDYLNPDGSVRRELRLPEEVFRADSLASYDGAPFTDRHPPALVSSKNARAVTVGTVLGAGRQDGDHVLTEFSITDAETIAKMEGGVRSLSVGYTVDLEAKAGTHPTYGRYDAIQRNIVVNHVALVENPRAGETARVRMDALDGVVDAASVAYITDDLGGGAPHAICVPAPIHYNHDHKQGTDQVPMADKNDIALEILQGQITQAQTKAAEADARATAATARADAAEQTAKAAEAKAATAEGALESTKQKLTALETARNDEATKLTTLTAERDTLTGERDALKARVDAAEAPERMQVRLMGVQVLGVARLDEVAKMDDRAVMVAVLQQLQPDGAKIEDNAKIEYVKGRFDVAIEGYKACGQALGDVRKQADEAGSKERTDAVDAARAAMIERNRNQWNKPKTQPTKGQE